MTTTTLPLNSLEYHLHAASRHAAIAAMYTGNDAGYLAYHANLSAYHATEALTALPAQTAPEGLAR